ncbi:MAG: UDP-N-acetylmuramate dehydrogenase [Rickettsiales bacterium]|jgi:UDP-N-acetylmuramate dehydrogenase|nr:UDP-N-acetylmuramate dehydrogenase [Rickettsiales bacterium]
MGEYKIDESLAKYSGFKTGGCAKVLFIPKNQDELINFLRKNDSSRITIIGCGYNLLIRDGGVGGTVVSIKNLNSIKLDEDKLTVECGTFNSRLFNFTADEGISGLEFLGCIPGTVGGACRMNAGCYGHEIKDILIELKAVDFSGNIKTFGIEECQMEYRKNNLPGNLIFLEAVFEARNKKSSQEIKKVFEEMFDKKSKTQPINEKTCGSVFKNLPDIPAWKIIQNLGLQDVDFGGVRFSQKHANFLVNQNSKSSKNIEDAIKLVQREAKSKLNIDLELEIEIIGDENEV